MEILIMISSILTLIVGTGGILFHKQNKRLKAAEAAVAEKEVLKKDLENQKSTNDEWIRLYDEKKNELSACRSNLSECQNKLQKATEVEGHQRLVINNLTWSRCIVNGCPNRTPPRNFEKKLETINNLHEDITHKNYKADVDYDNEEMLDD